MHFTVPKNQKNVSGWYLAQDPTGGA